MELGRVDTGSSIAPTRAGRSDWQGDAVSSSVVHSSGEPRSMFCKVNSWTTRSAPQILIQHDRLCSSCSKWHSLKWNAALQKGADTQASWNVAEATTAACNAGINPGTPIRADTTPLWLVINKKMKIDFRIQTVKESRLKHSSSPPPTSLCAHQTEIN